MRILLGWSLDPLLGPVAWSTVVGVESGVEGLNIDQENDCL